MDSYFENTKFDVCMKTACLQELKKEIRLHKFIASEESLSKEKWSKGNFKLCSKIIGQTLLDTFTHEEMINYGTSVSYKTIEHIFKNKYNLKNPIDPRSLCTLTKLAKFIGYNSWYDFKAKVDPPTQQVHEPIITVSPNLAVA